MQPKKDKNAKKTISFLIMKLNKIPEFTTQTLLLHIILMVQNFISESMINFSNGSYKSTIKGIRPLRIMLKGTTLSSF